MAMRSLARSTSGALRVDLLRELPKSWHTLHKMAGSVQIFACSRANAVVAATRSWSFHVVVWCCLLNHCSSIINTHAMVP